MITELKWGEWLTLSAEEIRKRGFESAERFRHIGHRRPMSLRWCLTIGMWGLKTPNEIMMRVGINPDPRTNARGTYDVFKNRHHLRAAPHFARHMVKTHIDNKGVEWNQATLGYTTHYLAKERMSVTRQPFEGRVIADTHLKLGILPIEVYLYYHAVEYILMSKGIAWEDWVDLDTVKIEHLWNTAYDGAPIVVGPTEELECGFRTAHHEEDPPVQ
jgi:hypothetical protein